MRDMRLMFERALFPGRGRNPLKPNGEHVEAAVRDGVVTLNGRVQSLSHKRLAGVLAWWVPGTRNVVNGLDVQPPEEDTDDEDHGRSQDGAGERQTH